jgi:hypothetical protein
LAEVFWLRITRTADESPGDLYGTVEAKDGLSSQYIFHRERSNTESV